MLAGAPPFGLPRAATWPDKEPKFLIGYLPLSLTTQTKQERQATAKNFFENCGDKPRSFRNGVALAVPHKDQVEILRRAVRYLLAIERIRSKPKQHNLTDVQKDQLREREATEKAAAESAFLKLYTEVWFPKLENSAVVIDPVEPGGLVLQTTLNEKKEARVHGRVMELVTQLKKRVFDSVSPTKIVELFRLGEGTPPTLGIRTSEIVSGFFSFLGFTRLISENVVQKAIVRGIKEGAFGYTAGAAPALGPDSKFQIMPSKVRFDTVVAEDEIDLESGFIMLPETIPQETPPPGPVPPGPTPPGPVPPDSVPPGSTSPTPGQPQTQVELTFSADRNQLFGAWNAVANLADLAGAVTVSIHAEKPDGFDKSKLHNGVIEPLREADLIE